MTDWMPLESNPEILTKYLHKLGVSPKWSVVDVYGVDPELLAFIPKPVKTVILLCNFDKYCKDPSRKRKADPFPDSLFYMKQYAQNACGTVALVHGIANTDGIEMTEGSILKKFLDDCKTLEPSERGHRMENDKEFMAVHQELAQQGQSEMETEDNVIHHYLAFVCHNNVLYEMDGHKLGPVNHGPTTPETLLEDAAKVCRSVMDKDPDDLSFSIIAIAPTQI